VRVRWPSPDNMKVADGIQRRSGAEREVSRANPELGTLQRRRMVEGGARPAAREGRSMGKETGGGR
jgi:hypothetical protein